MKRRDFLKTSAILGGSASLGAGAVSCVNSTGESQQIQYLDGEAIQIGLLKEFENDRLRVRLSNNASAEIYDKRNDMYWTMGPVALQEYGPIEEGHVWLMQERSMCQQYPGRFVGKMLNEKRIEFIVLGKQNRVRGSFQCEITLEREWLKYTIVSISEELNSLVFPPPIDSDTTISPQGIGKWVRETSGWGIYSRYIRTFWTHLNMRWFGGQKDHAAWICVYEDGFEDACAMEGNRSIAPGYMRTLDKWEHSYTVKYKFVKGNYVTLAKTYRKYSQDKGWFKSLDEKIKEIPELANFKGGRGFWMTLASGVPRKPDAVDFLLSEEQKEHRGMDEDVKIRFTYKEAEQLIKNYEELGMKKGFIKIAGWINKGYDWSHPDVWPPEPKLGEISELRQLMERPGNIITGLHDNYMDIYEGLPSWPKGVVRQRDGSLMTGGFWGGGQAYIMHYAESIKYAKRNWEKIKTLNPKAMFCDTVTAMQMYQNFEKGNLLTKTDDRKAKEEFMKFYKDQGQLFGSEEAADYSIPWVDWYETRFKRDEGNYLPLWLLSFHDAAFILRYGSSGSGGDYPRWLEDMLWGTNLHFFSHRDFDEEYFKSTFHVDKWNEKVGTAEMTNHRFLTEDFKVEQTEFSSGHSVIVNFSDEPRQIEGKLIKAKDYLIIT